MQKPTFFETSSQFRNWLSEHHESETELIVGFYKVKSGIPSMTWSDSVDQALCFGWIDGVRKSIDEQAYQIRYTPRKKDSIWSLVNLEKIKKLTKAGLMQPAGVAVFEARDKSKDDAYAYTKEEQKLPEAFEMRFKENKQAWAYFEALAPSYRKISIHHVISAVQEKTKLKRLNELIADSEAGTNKFRDSKYKK